MEEFAYKEKGVGGEKMYRKTFLGKNRDNWEDYGNILLFCLLILSIALIAISTIVSYTLSPPIHWVIPVITLVLFLIGWKVETYDHQAWILRVSTIFSFLTLVQLPLLLPVINALIIIYYAVAIIAAILAVFFWATEIIVWKVLY